QLRRAGRRSRGTGPPAVSRRARPANLRQCVEAGMAAVAGSPDDADQRVPAVADRAKGPPVPPAPDGEVLLRRRLRQAAGVSAEVGVGKGVRALFHPAPRAADASSRTAASGTPELKKGPDPFSASPLFLALHAVLDQVLDDRRIRQR